MPTAPFLSHPLQTPFYPSEPAIVPIRSEKKRKKKTTTQKGHGLAPGRSSQERLCGQVNSSSKRKKKKRPGETRIASVDITSTKRAVSRDRSVACYHGRDAASLDTLPKAHAQPRAGCGGKIGQREMLATWWRAQEPHVRNALMLSQYRRHMPASCASSGEAEPELQAHHQPELYRETLSQKSVISKRK